MTWAPFFHKNPINIEQAYHNVKFSISQLEEQLEINDASLDNQIRKRSDKGITVMKVGIKLIKKAFGLTKNVKVAA